MNINPKLNEIINNLSALNLLELNALITELRKKYQIQENTFLNKSLDKNDLLIDKNQQIDANSIEKSEIENSSTFKVVLTKVPTETRIAVLKVIRNLTSLDLKSAKDSISNLPKTIITEVSKEEAESAKNALENVGANAQIE